jgi:hypothetical protein
MLPVNKYEFHRNNSPVCLNKLETLVDENGFKLSRSKTVWVHFCQQRKCNPDPPLTLYGVDIPVLK